MDRDRRSGYSLAMSSRFDGSAKLFQIGVKPLAEADWLIVDDNLPAYLDEKDHLLATRHDDVFAAEPGTGAAQAEVLGLIVDHLIAYHPHRYRRAGDSIEVAGRQIALDAPSPLLTAARLVQEDLLLLRKDEAGWRLVVGSLSFPSSWSLREKMGRALGDIHAPVPGFAGGTRNDQLIARMFDNARPETPMLRWNWSLYGDDRLFHPDSTGPGERRFGPGERADSIFLRVERQTLRNLPQTGAMLFTVRIFVDPIVELEKQPDAARIAASLLDQLRALDPAQLDYKGMTLERDRAIERLGEIAERF